MSKLKIISRQKAQHAELLQVGFPRQTLTSQARVLGIDFCDRLNMASRSTANKRVQAAELQARRLCKTKAVPLQAKKMLWRTRIVPKAAWGCFFHMPKMTSLQAAYRKFMFVHALGSPDLRCILDGHTSDLHFVAGSLVASALRKMAISGRVRWYEQPKCGTWLHTVQRWLSEFGWQVAGPWKWCHAACRLSMDWMELLDMPNQERFKFLLDKFDHGIRETWRFTHFSAWLKSKRRDATALRGFVFYDEERFKLTRQMFESQNGHGKAVMVGAACSTAMYQSLRLGAVDNFCPWCQEPSVPAWDHLCWYCGAFDEVRPAIPQDLMQRRLGWPSLQSGHHFNAEVLAHMSSVRSKVLEKM